MFKEQKKPKLFKRMLVVMSVVLVIVGVSFVAGTVNSSLRPSDMDAVSKQKMITKNYFSRESIPSGESYVEYIDGAWWGGTLRYESYRYLPSSELYQATFSGMMERQE